MIRTCMNSFTDYLNALNDNLPDDLLFDTGDSNSGLPNSSVASGPPVGGIIASSAPTSVVGSIAGGPQVVVASGGMNPTTMNGVTTNCVMGTPQSMITPGVGPHVRPPNSMPNNPNINLVNALQPQPKLANGPGNDGSGGMNNGMMMVGPGPNMGMQPAPMSKMMIRGQPNNIVRGYLQTPPQPNQPMGMNRMAMRIAAPGGPPGAQVTSSGGPHQYINNPGIRQPITMTPQVRKPFW